MSYSSMKNADDHHIMTLTGEGMVTAVPDTAVLQLGVQTTGENLVDIQEENARLIQTVIQALEQLGITEIKTIQYDINRRYEFENGTQIDKGYSVRNILEIRTNQLDQVGEMIDRAVQSGANVVDLIRFEVFDSNNYYLQALNLAVLNAYEKAQSIMEGMGIMANPIPKSITENLVTQIPFQSIALREAMPVTPIESGNQPIKASVTVEFVY